MRTIVSALVLVAIAAVVGCGGGGRIYDRVTTVQGQMQMEHYKIENAIRDVRNQQVQSQQRLESMILSVCQGQRPATAPRREVFVEPAPASEQEGDHELASTVPVTPPSE